MIEGGTLKLSSTSTFSGKATFNGGLSGTLTGSLSGNATTATTLQTSRTIMVHRSTVQLILQLLIGELQERFGDSQ